MNTNRLTRGHGMSKVEHTIPAFMNMMLGNVTRLETIDHTACEQCKGQGIMRIEGQDEPFECPSCHGGRLGGREVVFFDDSKRINLELQDEGRTLKVYITKREEQNEQPY